MSSQGTNLADLRSLIARDLAASNELSTRIDQLRADIAAGVPLPAKKVDLMERSNKDMVKDLVSRLDKIENLPQKTATDREMEQALNVRLCVCDLHADRLATLRDLEHSARGSGEFLEPEMLKKSKSGSGKVTGEREGVMEPVLQLSTPGMQQRQEDEEPFEELIVGRSRYESDADDEEEEEVEPEPDKSTWPLLYRILDVDPEIWTNDFQRAADLALKKLALKHNPKNFPNDSDAPARWKAVMKAYSTLSNPGSKAFYDMQGKVPAELEDFDLARLSLD